MEYAYSKLGQLTQQIHWNSTVIRENWLSNVVGEALLLISSEVIQIKITGYNSALILKRNVYGTSKHLYNLGTNVYLLDTSGVSKYTSALVSEDKSSASVSVASIDYTQLSYTYGALISNTYPISSSTNSDTLNTTIGLSVSHITMPSVTEIAGASSFSINGFELKDVVINSMYSDGAGINATVVSGALTEVLRTTSYTDGAGINSVLVSGNMAVTAIDTSYTDGAGINATISSGTLG